MIDTLNPPVRGLIVDLDGVIWRGSQPLGDLPAIFGEIRAKGLEFTLATNNATATPETVLKRLNGFGVEIEQRNVVSSAMAVAHLLHQRFPNGGRVYVIGEEGLRSALAARGFEPAEQDVLAVVAGLDRQLTYAKLRQATLLIRSGVPFYGSNPDLTFPEPEGLVPGAGALLAALEAASGVKPTLAGKPLPALFELALERMGLTPVETLVVGDRLDTDIAGGQGVGCRTVMVLTGVNTAEEAAAWIPTPDFVIPSFSHLLFGTDGKKGIL